MKNKIKSRLLVPVLLCMGIFFIPVRAYAQADDAAASSATGGALSPDGADASDGAVPGDVPDWKADEDNAGAEALPDALTGSEENPFTPEGQASVTDHATDEDGKEFYTFTTPDENVFYLVIDNQREDKNVYFLNAVTEEDLAVLAEKSADGDMESGNIMPEIAVCTCMEKCEAGFVNVDCTVCKNDLEGCTGKEAEPEPGTEDGESETPEQKGGGGMAFVLLAVLAVGGAGYYFKVYRPKRELDDAEDLDDLLGGGEPEVNEDAETAGEPETEMEAEAERVLYDDYPDGDYPDDRPVQEEWERIDG